MSSSRIDWLAGGWKPTCAATSQHKKKGASKNSRLINLSRIANSFDAVGEPSPGFPAHQPAKEPARKVQEQHSPPLRNS